MWVGIGFESWFSVLSELVLRFGVRVEIWSGRWVSSKVGLKFRQNIWEFRQN